MKILVDLSACENLNWGVSVYATRLLKGFKDLGYNRITILVTKQIHEELKKEFPSFDYLVIPRISNSFLKKVQISEVFNSLIWRKVVNTNDCDIYFSPNPSILHFWRIKKIRVQTIHDLQGLKIYKGLSLWIRKLVIPMILKNADCIISISEFVKQDILKTYPFIKANKISTIYNSVILEESCENITEFAMGNYILYVNALKEYKNLLTLIKAFYILKDKIGHNLLIIGSPTKYWKNVIWPYILKKQITDRIKIISNVSNNELTMYYSRAKLFISPSLHEGFGYTPIEAAICYTPVITTEVDALYETTLGLLNYYHPALDEKALADKIMEVLHQGCDIGTRKQISDLFKEKYNYLKNAQLVYEKIGDTLLKCNKL